MNLILQNKLTLAAYNKNMQAFYNKWTSDASLEYINTTMRSIRKVQNDCSLLKICYDDKEKLEMLNEINSYIEDIEKNYQKAS